MYFTRAKANGMNFKPRAKVIAVRPRGSVNHLWIIIGIDSPNVITLAIDREELQASKNLSKTIF